MTLDQLVAFVESALSSATGGVRGRENGLSVTIWRDGAVDADVGRDTTVDAGLAPGDTIVSSMYGQFHLHADDGSLPFVSLGDSIEAGQRVALVEAMKSFCPVVTQRAGRIVEIFVAHGAEVSVGQPLFRVE